MIKCRVKRVGLRYHPQYRKFIFWRNVSNYQWNICSHDFRNKFGSFNRILYAIESKYNPCYSLEDAENRLAKFIKENLVIDSYKGHRIHKVYNVFDQNSYSSISEDIYVDVSYATQTDKRKVYVMFGESINDVMKQIDSFEQEKELSRTRQIYTYNE